MSQPLLAMRGICKRFPGVVALDKVDLSVRPGEVVTLLGENGAGKSTLMKILGGVYQPDEGSIEIGGQEVRIFSVADANRLGIGFVHQELSCLDNLDVAGNVFLGREPLRGGFLRLIDRRRIEENTTVQLKRLGLDIPPRTPLSRLSIAQKQLVEIAKALSMDARILILDEPTSSLTLTETEWLMSVVRDLRSQGISIIYISHRLGEVRECGDRAVVLRDGRNAGELDREHITHDAMVKLMVGRDLEIRSQRAGGPLSEHGFEVRGLCTSTYPRCRVSFTVRRGEILCLAGLVGSGRTEVARAIFGIDQALAGECFLDDKPVPLGNTDRVIRHGVYLIPEDRRRDGLVTDMNIRENISLASLGRHSSGGLIRRASEVQAARAQMRSLHIKAPSEETLVSTLSGGNQQKVAIGKWLSMNPSLLILDEPTRGVDVGAKAEIYALMRDLATRGVAILMISSDMEEVLGVSDRIAVMHEGEIAGYLERSDFSEEAVMGLAVGGKKS
jgi:ribose transport system ATP-binding protein